MTVTSTWGAQSSGVVSRNGLRWVAAALLTSTSIGPSSRSTRSTAAATAPSARMSARDGQRLHAERARLGRRGLGPARRRVVVEGHVGPFAGEGQADGPAQALPGAGDQHDLAAELEIHGLG